MPKTNTCLSGPVYDYLLEQIMSGQYKPGERIPETKVAAVFGISRTPVRDAMRRLASDGLIDLQPHRFAQVAKYTSDTIRDIGMLRISLDSMAIKLAMLYGNQSEFMELRGIAETCEQGMLTNNDALRRTADCDFHLALARISGNRLLLQFQTELYLRVNFVLLQQPNIVVNKQRHIRQHFQIVDALAAHDEEGALRIITEHLFSFYDLSAKVPERFFHLGAQFPHP
ncbi:GntR family transcriptional regulator [Butyricicoccus faecihominis]|uniref:GntR family transcriptional regulator n=1 Tax=Butyricicoccus faecihominis TaxID=1712515 RepID=UPI002478EED8|nr:GntR family transcriptional regulator [Butyricicoccus faecihominis]MCQ5130083.1 GntR family transcriptional regulator [Butyricicoccus faecihominis]